MREHECSLSSFDVDSRCRENMYGLWGTILTIIRTLVKGLGQAAPGRPLYEAWAGVISALPGLN